MNNQTIQCRDDAGTIGRVIRTIDRGEVGWAYELQLPSGKRTTIEPPLTERYTIIPEMFSLQLGQVVATPGVLEAMTETGESPVAFLQRHQIGDWGELDHEDLHANELALASGSRILSVYLLNDGTKIYVITEAVGDDGERQSTCVLLPDEY
jgi:hypothetical protein